MQRCNCTVRIGGDVGNTVQKSGVSPAELVVLEAIHGEGSVVDIQPTHMDKTPHHQERSRIATIYGQHVLDRLFPGEFNSLPVSLKQVRIGGQVQEQDEGEDGEGNADDAAKPGDAGDAKADEGAQTAQGDQTNAGEDEDDRLLRERIAGAKTKAELYEIAKDNEVDLTNVNDKMDDLRAAIIQGAFGGE